MNTLKKAVLILLFPYYYLLKLTLGQIKSNIVTDTLFGIIIFCTPPLMVPTIHQTTSNTHITYIVLVSFWIQGFTAFSIFADEITLSEFFAPILRQVVVDAEDDM